MATQLIPRVSEEEYLRVERAAEYKSELLDGEIFVMSGGSLRHSLLAVRWASHLDLQLRGKIVMFSRPAHEFARRKPVPICTLMFLQFVAALRLTKTPTRSW